MLESLKFIVLGEGRVGKSSILNIYFNKKFNQDDNSVIMPAFYEKTERHDGKTYRLVFWDTAGQEQFNAINNMYYQNAVGALIVYDVTIPETFDKAKRWVNTLREVVGNDIIFVIAGNYQHGKIVHELFDKNKAYIDDYCKKEKCSHFYVSSKTGENIEQTFNCLITSVLKKINEKSNIKRGRGRQLQIKTHDGIYFNEKGDLQSMKILNKYINF